MKKKKEKTEKQIKKEILEMSEIEIKINTKYIIYFEDFGQDFLEWYIDKNGYILDSKPFQRSIWAGHFTVPENAQIGGQLDIWLGKESYINYPIKKIKIIKDKGNKK